MKYYTFLHQIHFRSCSLVQFERKVFLCYSVTGWDSSVFRSRAKQSKPGLNAHLISATFSHNRQSTNCWAYYSKYGTWPFDLDYTLEIFFCWAVVNLDRQSQTTFISGCIEMLSPGAHSTATMWIVITQITWLTEGCWRQNDESRWKGSSWSTRIPTYKSKLKVEHNGPSKTL